jgi:hypothetical protein
MVSKQTSPTVSNLAAKLMGLDNDGMTLRAQQIGWSRFCDEIRSVAASCVSQDETPGQERPHAQEDEP